MTRWEIGNILGLGEVLELLGLDVLGEVGNLAAVKKIGWENHAEQRNSMGLGNSFPELDHGATRTIVNAHSGEDGVARSVG